MAARSPEFDGEHEVAVGENQNFFVLGILQFGCNFLFKIGGNLVDYRNLEWFRHADSDGRLRHVSAGSGGNRACGKNGSGHFCHPVTKR